MARLWGIRDGVPWMVNPYPVGGAGLAGGSLAVWNPPRPRRKRRRATMARRRHKGQFAPARRRRRRPNPPRRRRRSRAVMRRYSNAPRRRRSGFIPGLPPFQQLLPPAVAGIGAGLLIGWGTPLVSAQLGLAPAGFMYRAAQAAVGLVGAWALGAFRVLDRTSTVAFATVGIAIAGLGLVNDFMRGQVGVTAAAAPAAVSGLGQDDEYDAMVGYYEPYGTGPTMGYYEAVA